MTASVAVVVPVFRERLRHDEEISLCHLRTYLAAYDAYVALPESLDLDLHGLEPARLDPKFWASLLR